MGDAVGSVAALWRYPVKSLQGERVEVARLGPAGLDGDRRFALVDEQTGHVASAKRPRRWGGLLAARAQTTPDGVGIVLPDGAHLTAGTPEADEALRAWCGRAVRLADTPPRDATLERVAPAVEPDGGTLAVRQLAVDAPDGTFFDYAPLHLVTTASLVAAAPAGAGCIDARRVRPNLVVATDTDGFVEDGWVGRLLRVGEAVLRVGLPSPRCAIPGLAQGGAVPTDPAVLPAIAARHRIQVGEVGVFASLGVYARIEQPGRVAVGDPVVVASDR